MCQLIREPTRVTDRTATLLDHILVSDHSEEMEEADLRDWETSNIISSMFLIKYICNNPCKSLQLQDDSLRYMLCVQEEMEEADFPDYKLSTSTLQDRAMNAVITVFYSCYRV